MQQDIYLVVGIIILVLAIPAVVSAFSDGRVPRAAAVMVLIGGVLIALALNQQPGGYAVEDIPMVFTRVIALIVN